MLDSICFKFNLALPSVLPKSNESLLSSSESYSSLDNSSNGGKFMIVAASEIYSSTASLNLFFQRLMQSLLGAPEDGHEGVELEAVNRMTGLLPGAPVSAYCKCITVILWEHLGIVRPES